MKGNTILARAGLVIMSVLLSLLLAEGVLSLAFPSRTKYFTWQPNLRHTFYPDTSTFKGISGPSHFTINNYGVRVDAIEADHELNLFKTVVGNGIRALCIGGSTTECLYLDDDETWPEQVKKNDNTGAIAFMGNIGESGLSSRENYIQLKYCVPQYKAINTVIVMTGLNDLAKRLAQDTGYDSNFRFTQAVEDSLIKKTFLKQGRSEGKTWLRRTALFYLIQNAVHRYKPQGVKWEIQDDSGRIYKVWRENRASASRMIDSLPDLTTALSEFEINLNLMIDEAQKQKLNIVFVNQSAIWKDSLNDEEMHSLWMGGIGKYQGEKGCAYYTPHALRKGLDLYNQKLVSVCAKRQVRLIDIDAQIPRSYEIFYDDCHFTEAGARLVGKLVYAGLTH